MVGSEPRTLLNINEHSDTLKMYLDMSLLRSVAETEDICDFEFRQEIFGQRIVLRLELGARWTGLLSCWCPTAR